MQKTTCGDCGARYWIRNLTEKRECPACGGSGLPNTTCSECPNPIPGSKYSNMRKTCGHKCALAREARLMREKREARGLKRLATTAGPRDMFGAPIPTHVCAGYRGYKCTVRTADRRCPSCRARWRADHDASGLNGLGELFTAGQCFADVG